MAVAAFVVACVAITISFVAAKYARDQAHHAERSADVSERDEQRALRAAEAVNWRFDRRGSMVIQWHLINDGPGDALDVVLKVGHLEGGIEEHYEVSWARIDHGGRQMFGADGRFLNDVLVTWVSPSGTHGSWRSKLLV